MLPYKQSKNRNQTGYVLFIALIFLQLFSFIGLYELTTASTANKTNFSLWQREKSLLALEELLHELERNIIVQTPICMISPIPPGVLARKPFSWWQDFSCSGNFFNNRYYYVVELLGEDACALVNPMNSKQTSVVNYYRVTLLSLPKALKKVKIILQSTFIKLSDKDSICAETPHIVRIGQPIWREI